MIQGQRNIKYTNLIYSSHIWLYGNLNLSLNKNKII
jgi:hypothetical protein